MYPTQEEIAEASERIRKTVERQRTKRMIMFYGIIFLVVAAIFTNPLWSWCVLVFGTTDWITCKIWKPIRVVFKGVKQVRVGEAEE